MKTKLLTLFSLLALLAVSTVILADGRPTGLRIGGVRNVGASGVEIDITVPGTDSLYSGNANWGGNTTVWLGNGIGGSTRYDRVVWQYSSSTRDVPLPWAIEWGDYSGNEDAVIFGPPGGPFTGSFSHTYPPAGMPMTYTITVGDALCCSPLINKGTVKGADVTTGNVLTGTVRYLTTFGAISLQPQTFSSQRYARQAVTNTATVTTSTGIPALNVYGLLAMAFLLVGTGLLVYRKPQSSAA